MNNFDISNKRIWVAGHRGMVGNAIVRRLAKENCDIVTADRKNLDLTCQADVKKWMQQQKPQIIFIAAAKVGGIYANNTYPANFLYENLVIETNIIHAAWEIGVEKLLFLGSSCIYPRDTIQPIIEDSLLTGPLEKTNEWYSIAKIAGIKLCQSYRKQYGCDFISVMPTNLYGPGDNFHPENSHVPAALLRRFHEAKIENKSNVVVWGTGKPRREFLHVDDLADACVFLMKNYSDDSHINIGTGEDITIAEFASMIRNIVDYKGAITFDISKPDGTPRKMLDVSKLSTLGWNAQIPLKEGLKNYYDWFLKKAF